MPLAVAVCVFAGIEALILPLRAVSGHFLVLSQFHVFDLFAAILDWTACICALLVCFRMSPERLCVPAMSICAFLVGLFHVFAIYQLCLYFPDDATTSALLPLSITYFGGLLVISAALCFIYEHTHMRLQVDRQRRMAALAGPSAYAQALEQVGIVDGRRIASSEPPLVVPDTVPNLSSYLDFDLVLLEDELLKMRPNREAYMAALRLGMAIEKDRLYVNCRARTVHFADLMMDIAMRLNHNDQSGASMDAAIWLDLISGFRDYKNLSHQDRVRRLDFYQEILAQPIDHDLKVDPDQKQGQLALNNI